MSHYSPSHGYQGEEEVEGLEKKNTFKLWGNKLKCALMTK